MFFSVIIALFFTSCVCLNETENNDTIIHGDGVVHLKANGDTYVKNGEQSYHYIRFSEKLVTEMMESYSCDMYCVISIAVVTFLCSCFSFCASGYFLIVMIAAANEEQHNQKVIKVQQQLYQQNRQPVQQQEPEKKSKVQSIKSKVEKAALEVSKRSRKSKKSVKETSEKNTAIADGSQKQGLPVDGSQKQTGATASLLYSDDGPY